MTDLLRSRLGIILPLGIFAIFFAFYSFVWIKGADVMRSEIAAFAAKEEAQGRSFTYDDIKTGGYPFSLRGKVEGVDWDHPDWGQFTAEEVLIVAVPYEPTRIVFAPRGERTVTIGEETYDLQSDDLRFNLQPKFSAMEAHGLTLIGEDRTITVGDVIANQQDLGTADTMAVSVKQLAFGGEDPITIPFFDLAASEEAGVFNLAGMTTAIGRASDVAPTQLAGDGELRINSEGLATGALELKFKNEGPLLDILVESQGIGEGTASTAKSLLGLMTNNGTKEMTLPLLISDNEVKLGIIPLGTIPPFEN